MLKIGFYRRGAGNAEGTLKRFFCSTRSFGIYSAPFASRESETNGRCIKGFYRRDAGKAEEALIFFVNAFVSTLRPLRLE